MDIGLSDVPDRVGVGEREGCLFFMVYRSRGCGSVGLRRGFLSGDALASPAATTTTAAFAAVGGVRAFGVGVLVG